MTKFKWSGLDEEIKDQQENYIMRKFWSNGTVAAFNIKHTQMLGFTLYNAQTYNMYDYAETIVLTNERSSALIPMEPQVVNKDAVIGWCMPNHKPIKAIVDWYIDRMVQVDMVTATNLELQKMPFLVAVSEEDRKKMEDIVDRILNNEVVVFADLESLQKVQTLATQTPYIIDKLQDYREQLECELLTVLGIDNNRLNKTHIAMDAINANNDVINDYGQAIENTIKTWIDKINNVFGKNISIEATSKPVTSVSTGEPNNNNAGGNNGKDE